MLIQLNGLIYFTFQIGFSAETRLTNLMIKWSLKDKNDETINKQIQIFVFTEQANGLTPEWSFICT